MRLSQLEAEAEASASRITSLAETEKALTDKTRDQVWPLYYFDPAPLLIYS